jgi:glycosyltransferase involved in cell wall biosynthesis
MRKCLLPTKKISFFIPSLQGGGAEKAIMNLASGLAERGLDIDLILVNAKGPFLLDLSVKVHVVDLGASRVLASLPGLVRYLRREKPKVVLSSLEHANIIAVFAKVLSCAPTNIILCQHTPLSFSLPSPNRLIGKIMPSLVRMCYSKADVVVSVSRGVSLDLISNFGLEANKVRTIYNPIINSQLYDLGYENISHPWFKPEHPPVIIAVGRLSVEKDYPTLIHAFHQIRSQRSVRLVIIGEGDERLKLETIIRELNLGDDVDLPGFVRNPYALMMKASCFVLSSLFEGFGNVLVEALAMGCPVVSTDCPTGPAEILEGGRWGSLIPVGDSEAMAAAILKNLDIIRKNTPPPLTSYLQRFELDEVMSQYLDVIFADNH